MYQKNNIQICHGPAVDLGRRAPETAEKRTISIRPDEMVLMRCL